MSTEFWNWYEKYAEPYLGIRRETFRLIFEYLDTLKHVHRIVETGCARRPGWTEGGSTELFARYVACHPGSRFRSVDLDPESVIAARARVGDGIVCQMDSIAHLHAMRMESDWYRLDLLYLDSYDVSDLMNPGPAAAHHLAELAAAMPMLSRNTLVVVDDAPMSNDIVIGKGMLVGEFARRVGAKMVFSVYQTGWIGL